jgi:hypothetical protein
MPKRSLPNKTSSQELPAPINPHDVQSVYSNNMEVVCSSLDARLAFNEIISDHGVVTVVRRAHVVTPLQHLRAMAQALTFSLAQLEEKTKAQSEITAKK